MSAHAAMGSGGNMGFLSSSLWLPPHKYYGQLMEENQQTLLLAKASQKLTSM
jgi:hypothetical protein